MLIARVNNSKHT